MDNKKLDIELYGFCGKSGVGKNYVAERVFYNIINRNSPKNTLIMAFADHIKIDMCIKQNFKYEDVFYNKTDEIRRHLQTYGTEMGRDVYGENIWVDAMIYWIQTYYDRGVKRFIITDVRFENEMQFIKKCGGYNILVEAPSRSTISPDNAMHVSENSLNNNYIDYRINNDRTSSDKLESSIEDMIISMKV